MDFQAVKSGVRMFGRNIGVSFKGFKKYNGNSIEICRNIVKDCYNKNKNYFQVSNGNFSEFYMRDFGWCAESLRKLGYKNEINNTLNYALAIYEKHNKITTTISKNGIPYDFPAYSVDSLPFLVRCLKINNNRGLIKRYETFISRKSDEFFEKVVDKNTGLVKNEKFSSIKDHSFRNSSCYDNVMVAMLSDDLNELNLDNPLKNYNFKKILVENFWHDNYFLDDLSGHKIVTADANIFPFWTKVIENKKMLKNAVEKIRENNLDKPFPLKYAKKRFKELKTNSFDLLAPNYEGNTIWWHIGPMYIKLVKEINKGLFAHYLEQYRNVIEKYHNYLEVFNPDGTPYRTLFYSADEGMLWASMYLELIR